MMTAKKAWWLAFIGGSVLLGAGIVANWLGAFDPLNPWRDGGTRQALGWWIFAFTLWGVLGFWGGLTNVTREPRSDHQKQFVQSLSPDAAVTVMRVQRMLIILTYTGAGFSWAFSFCCTETRTALAFWQVIMPGTMGVHFNCPSFLAQILTLLAGIWYAFLIAHAASWLAAGKFRDEWWHYVMLNARPAFRNRAFRRTALAVVSLSAVLGSVLCWTSYVRVTQTGIAVRDRFEVRERDYAWKDIDTAQVHNYLNQWIKLKDGRMIRLANYGIDLGGSNSVWRALSKYDPNY